MKKFILFLILQIGGFNICAQTIPYGISFDSLSTADGHKYQIYYYKPLTYDSLTSPILWGLHGTGGNGMSEIVDLTDIAERRSALIVAPSSLIAGWGYTDIDTIQGDTIVFWGPTIFKEVYRHVIARELRDTMWVHLIGFSAGGQGVTRYMLLRQVFPDSIPIRMAVSSNPLEYAFCTDFLNGSCMPWPCGLGIPGLPYSFLPLVFYDVYFVCNEHVVQYYNENYAVLIGTADNGGGGGVGGCQCVDAQGGGRYERALNFYNFSTSDAVLRNTTLQWQYSEIAGINHNQAAMYNTKALPTDSSTIAETLLFDTPYHTVPSVAPAASFYADTTLIHVNGTINFFNTSINATGYLWDFGDGTTSTVVNPSHIYPDTGIYTVTLTAYNGIGCGHVQTITNYITVINPTAIHEINANGLYISIYPNPVTENIHITMKSSTQNVRFRLYDVIGNEITDVILGNHTSVDVKTLGSGIYFYRIISNENIVITGKIIKQ